jgi:signal peptidase II
MIHRVYKREFIKVSVWRHRALLAFFLMVTTVSVAIDQVGKAWAFASWRIPGGPREIIPGLFAGAQGRNYGGIYSLEGFGTPMSRGALSVIGLIAIGMILRWAFVLDRDRWRIIDAIAGGLLLGGALGNQLDRLVLGYVRDYLVLAVRPFEIFNTGDVFMVLGATLLLGSLSLRRRPPSAFIRARLIPGVGD